MMALSPCYLLLSLMFICLPLSLGTESDKASLQKEDFATGVCQELPCDDAIQTNVKASNIYQEQLDVNNKESLVVTLTADQAVTPSDNADKKIGEADIPSEPESVPVNHDLGTGMDSDDGQTIIDAVAQEGNDHSIPESSVSEERESEEEEAENPSLQVIGFSKQTGAKLEEKVETSTPKRKLLSLFHAPLFSTFKSLLRSFLSEFVEDASQEGSSNSSDLTNQSAIAEGEELDKDLNTTSNGTDHVKRTRFQCTIKNITLQDVGKVKIVNSTELLEILSLSKSQKMSACVLVLFYAPWCHFCAQTAPHYNALARAFPQLDVLAVDTSHFSYLNARFGTVAVPNIMMFHSRSAVRFNHTQRVFDKFTQFVTNNTGLEPKRHILLEPLDFVGPLPCIVHRGRDWLLWLAWIFVSTCAAYSFVCSQYGQGLYARLKVLWQEHQHID